MRACLILFSILYSLSGWSQSTLSNEARISLITCGPGSNELYSAFGHSAVRVRDPKQGIDYAFNYGIFDFDQPNFYLNFARGQLNYMLAVNRWPNFFRAYQREGRYVREQTLNLDSTERQAYWEFLLWNARPENRNYLYDYFYDNCATRIRDGLNKALLQSNISYSEESYFKPAKSIRELCDVYLAEQPWGDFAIDFCLGAPMDKKADAQIEMFLPDLLAEAFSKSTIGPSHRPLISKDKMLLEQSFSMTPAGVNQPFFYTALLLVLGVFLTLFGYEKPRSLRFFDGILWMVLGLMGLFLTGLWFFTDHQAAAYNFNLLVFSPLLLIPAWSLLKGSWSKGALLLIRFSPYYFAFVLAAWMFLPQKLLLSLIPLVALLILRTWHYYHKRDSFRKPHQ